MRNPRLVDAVDYAWRALHGKPLPPGFPPHPHGNSGDVQRAAQNAEPSAPAVNPKRAERNAYHREYRRRRREKLRAGAPVAPG